jgi:putative flippase GtrA
MVVLIPAYEPDERMLDLIVNIKKQCDFNIVIVDDGSGDCHSHIFKSAVEQGCIVLSHDKNMGKGCALKTGFSYIEDSFINEGVICADCDGQHLPDDIIRISRKVDQYPGHIILGCRRFTGKVPFRSIFGNTTTRLVFSLVTGEHIYDTQTGLRGFSYDMLKWLCGIQGERFEYEMNMLLDAKDEGYPFYEVDINTIYLKNNKSSHFHSIRDSAKVYLPILKFSASSIISALIDVTLLMLIQYFTSNLLIAVIGARVLSSICNYTMNKAFVFSKGKKTCVKDSLPRYFTLVIIVMFFNYGLIYVYNEVIGILLIIAKLLAEGTIFLFSYWSQRKFVFKY